VARLLYDRTSGLSNVLAISCGSSHVVEACLADEDSIFQEEAERIWDTACCICYARNFCYCFIAVSFASFMIVSQLFLTELTKRKLWGLLAAVKFRFFSQAGLL
jgi:hypothetical protein